MRAKVPSRWASYDGGWAGTTNTSSPPWRGRSWAPAGAAMSASSSANGRRIRHLLSTPGGEGLVRASLRKPHRVELVVQVMARRHRPALHPGVVRDDPVPLQRVHPVHLLVEQTLLELPDVLLPLLEIDRPALFYVELVENGVLVPGIVCVADPPWIGRGRPALELVEIQIGLDHVAALGVHGDLEVPTAQIGEPLRALGDLLRHVETDLAPLVDQPDAERLVRHRDPAILEREHEALRHAGFLQEPPRFRPRLDEVAPVTGQLLELRRRGREWRPRHLDARHLLDGRDLGPRLRALVAVERVREREAYLLVIQGLLLVVHGDEQDAVPGALPYRDPRAQGCHEAVPLGGREAAELDVRSLTADRRHLGRGVLDEERPVA